MITPSFAITATERVLPRMALDFTTASLDSRVTLTRSGNTATVVNSSGLVAAINANLPRFDYDPVTRVCKGLLIEEARTNIALNSSDFASGSYSKNSSSITAAAITSPDGTLNGSKLVEAAATAEHTINCAVPLVITANTSNTVSIFAKSGERTSIEIFFVTGTYSSGVRYSFNLNAGTIGSAGVVGLTTGYSANITNYGNGWYRCSVTAILDALSTTANFNIGLNDGAGTYYTGNGTSGAYIYGVQTEAGAFATSYIPTTTATVTRNADVAVMTGTNFSDWYNASEGAFVASTVLSRQSSTGATAIFSANDNTSANLINCFYRASGALGSNIFNTSVSQLDQTPLGVTAANTVVNIGVAYKLNDSVAYANGTVQTTDTSVTVPTINQLQFGFTPSGAYLNGYVRNLRFYKQRILNAEGQAFSK